MVRVFTDRMRSFPPRASAARLMTCSSGVWLYARTATSIRMLRASLFISVPTNLHLVRLSFPLRRRGWGRPGEFCCIYCDVQLYLGQFRGGLPIRPGRGPFEGDLHTGDITVIRVVDLRGDAADRSIDEAHQANQKAGLIEIQIHGRLPRVRSLKHLDVTIIDGSRSDSPLIECWFESCRKQHHRLELRA